MVGGFFFVSGQKGVSVEKESCLCVVPLYLRWEYWGEKTTKCDKIDLGVFFY